MLRHLHVSISSLWIVVGNFTLKNLILGYLIRWNSKANLILKTLQRMYSLDFFYRAVQFLNKLAFQYFNYLTIVFIQLIFKQFSLDVRTKDRPHELSTYMFSIYFNQGCFMTHFCNSYENINTFSTCSLMYLVLFKHLLVGYQT